MSNGSERPEIAGYHLLWEHANISWQECQEPTRFGLSGRDERITLVPPLCPGPQLPMWSEGTMHPILVEEHYQYPVPPPICGYAVPDASIWDYGFITRDQHFILLNDCIPGYARAHVHPGGNTFPIELAKPEKWQARKWVVLNRPVSCPMHYNFIYGHFLLEMLPRLYILALLQHLGTGFALTLPDETPGWAREFVEFYFPDESIFWFDRNYEYVTGPSVIISSMMHVNHNFHAFVNVMIADIRARSGLPPFIGEKATASREERRIFLSRKHLNTHKRLINEEEVEALAQRMGFEIVHPEQMSVRSQLGIFDAATVVMGEAGSALHNTLFSRPGTRVISLGSTSWYQSAIGRLRQQPHAFVPPEDGNFRHWRMTGGGDHRYRFGMDQIEAAICAMCEAESR